MQGPPLKQPPPSAYSSKARKVTHKTISLVTLKSTKGRLTTQIVTEVIVCLADLDHCSVPIVTQLVKEQVGYDLILLNNKLYPILVFLSTHGEFWQSPWKILAASGKAVKIMGKRLSAKGTEIDLTGDEDTDSPLASPSAAKKLKFEEEVKSDLNDVK